MDYLPRLLETRCIVADDSYMAGDGKNACLWEEGICSHGGLSEAVQQLSRTRQKINGGARYTAQYVSMLYSLSEIPRAMTWGARWWGKASEPVADMRESPIRRTSRGYFLPVREGDTITLRMQTVDIHGQCAGCLPT